MLDFQTFTLVYLILGIGLVAFLSLYYDRRDAKRVDARRNLSARHCARCGHLYASPVREGEAECPRCGLPNQRMRF